MAFDVEAEARALCRHCDVDGIRRFTDEDGCCHTVQCGHPETHEAVERIYAAGRAAGLEELWVRVGANGAACSMLAHIDACRSLVQRLKRADFPEPAGDDALLIYRWHEWAVSSIGGEVWTMPSINLVALARDGGERG